MIVQIETEKLSGAEFAVKMAQRGARADYQHFPASQPWLRLPFQSDAVSVWYRIM